MAFPSMGTEKSSSNGFISSALRPALRSAAMMLSAYHGLPMERRPPATRQAPWTIPSSSAVFTSAPVFSTIARQVRASTGCCRKKPGDALSRARSSGKILSP